MRVLTCPFNFPHCPSFLWMILTNSQRKSHVRVGSHTLPSTLPVQQHTFSIHRQVCLFFLIHSKPVLFVNERICISTFFSQGNNKSGFLTSILFSQDQHTRTQVTEKVAQDDLEIMSTRENNMRFWLWKIAEESKLKNTASYTVVAPLSCSEDRFGNPTGDFPWHTTGYYMLRCAQLVPEAGIIWPPPTMRGRVRLTNPVELGRGTFPLTCFTHYPDINLFDQLIAKTTFLTPHLRSCWGSVVLEYNIALWAERHVFSIWSQYAEVWKGKSRLCSHLPSVCDPLTKRCSFPLIPGDCLDSGRLTWLFNTVALEDSSAAKLNFNWQIWLATSSSNRNINGCTWVCKLCSLRSLPVWPSCCMGSTFLTSQQDERPGQVRDSICS